MGDIDSQLVKIPKGYKNSKLGYIPTEWEVKSIGEISQVISGYAFPSTKFKETGIPVLKIENVTINGINLKTDSYISSQLSESEKRVLIHNADILIALTRPLLGKKLKIGIFNSSENFLLNQRNAIIRSDDNFFIFYNFTSPYTINEIDQLSNESSQPNISASSINKLQIRYPPLNERQKIAAILSSVDEAIDKTRLVLQKTEWLKKGLMQVLLTRGMPGWHSEYKETRVLYSIYKIAKCWEVRKIVEITEVVSGKTPHRKIKSYYGKGYPWIKTTDLNGNTVTTTEEEITDQAIKEVNMHLIPKKTIMIAMYGGPGTVGKSAYSGIDAYTNQSIAAIIPNPNKFHFKFLHYLILYMRPYWMNISASSRKDPNITKGDVLNLLIPYPPITEQNKIVTILDSIDNKLQSLKSDLKKLTRIKKGLMQQLLTGKIRVKI